MYGIGPDNLVLNRLGEEYPELLKHVLACGETVSSRIGETREVRDLRLRIRDPLWCLVQRAGMSDAFMYEELTQLLAGIYDGERIAALVPRAAELLSAPTAYGPRIYPQLLWACEELRENPYSRRAVVYVGHADDLESLRDYNQNQARAGEMPCTCLWQFQLRNGCLTMSVYMRSWDLVWGLSYDVPSFVAVQLAVAAHVKARLGHYVHTSGSAHIYERHYGLKDVVPRFETLHLGDLIGDSILQTRENALRELDLPLPT